MRHIEAKFQDESKAEACRRKLNALRAHAIQVVPREDGYIVTADVNHAVLDQAYAVMRDSEGTLL
ncbi:hypothetical protein WJ0W_002390 [Paenibacillus melissococcoides]|uniref:Uncharacterized protein n=1 Tax=Paenibacillus melissococcoides TaxID=2912268 RepID=A0ABN8U4H6_9BACL|nr:MULTISPECIES: hypothetical protein [Paenibacillus]MEB9897566.1 hypothetical protein [Bacillus cereus]CAH8245160.1 hypothetical protein WJ0W_002390 [Paenibacillus melissococcoides]CAH8710148.1 hypothetical protein WDD9_002472 [Paenibacillus melissococcoides]CAH8710917.1 hypothetical protein HTL2_002772 [Paenibacillus melissococcoides]GIO79779.1 hypothetical protein J6TS7_33890 [Paenibacillus dendritiformis]